MDIGGVPAADISGGLTNLCLPDMVAELEKQGAANPGETIPVAVETIPVRSGGSSDASSVTEAVKNAVAQALFQ